MQKAMNWQLITQLSWAETSFFTAGGDYQLETTQGKIFDFGGERMGLVMPNLIGLIEKCTS